MKSWSSVNARLRFSILQANILPNHFSTLVLISYKLSWKGPNCDRKTLYSQFSPPVTLFDLKLQQQVVHLCIWHTKHTCTNITALLNKAIALIHKPVRQLLLRLARISTASMDNTTPPLHTHKHTHTILLNRENYTDLALSPTYKAGVTAGWVM